MTREDIKGMRRIDLLSKPFEISGLPWAKERGNYDRIPSDLMPQEMSSLQKEIGRETTGGLARIVTNSTRMYFEANVAMVKTTLYQMSQVSRSGFDFHIRYEDEPMRFLQTSCPIEYGSCHMEYEVAVKRKGLFDETAPRTDHKLYELRIVMPTYNQVKEACIYVDADAQVQAPPPMRYSKPIVFYGSSITQGGCTTRPSLCYTNRLMLDLDCPIINFGFAGNAFGEKGMAELIAKQEMSIFVMDYDHNAPNAEHLAKTHEPFFKIIRKSHPTVPVVFLTKPDYGLTLDDNDVRRNIIFRTYENALAAGDKNVYFVDGKDYFGDEIGLCLVDSCHPNDYGSHIMVTKLKPLIRQLVEEHR